MYWGHTVRDMQTFCLDNCGENHTQTDSVRVDIDSNKQVEHSLVSNSMRHLGLLYAQLTLVLHHVYAEYYPPLVLFNPQNGQQLEPARYLPALARQQDFVPSISDNVVELPSMGRPCSCQDYVCRCCLGIGFGSFKQMLCVGIRYDWRELSVGFQVELNNYMMTGFRISPRNLPDFCTPLMMPIPLFTCLRISNVHLEERSMDICISLVFKLIFRQIFEYKFNCLRFAVNGVAIVPDGAVFGDEQQNPSEVQMLNDKLQIYKA